MYQMTMFLTVLTLTVLVTTIDAQWEGMGDVGSARYEPALLPPCLTIRVLSYSNYTVRTPTTLTYVRVVQDGGRYVMLSSFWGLFC